MIIDIRKEQKEEVTGIKFDDSTDYISWSGDTVVYNKPRSGDVIAMIKFKNLHNLIAALHKAKELAGK